jgi:hypothetical protein
MSDSIEFHRILLHTVYPSVLEPRSLPTRLSVGHSGPPNRVRLGHTGSGFDCLRYVVEPAREQYLILTQPILLRGSVEKYVWM